MPDIKAESRKPLWTPARLAFTIVVLSLFAMVGVSSCNSNDETRSSVPTPANTPAAPVRNAPAPQPVLTTLPANVLESELKALTGAPIKLSNYDGKVLLVNLWATWCTPCRVETPELVNLYKENRARGLEIVGLSTENPEDSAEKVRQFVQDFEVNYRIGWATPEVALTLMQGRDAIPQSFVIGRDGRVIKRFVGFNPSSTPPLLKAAIEEALNGKAPAD
ncbi:MAG TPA: TlpA disulfide reductase family protein [Pyrinomonadaceae bacterium]|nr:TlpA disulfide reductase family protein [Pyrinomonadaceae bacterium]